MPPESAPLDAVWTRRTVVHAKRHSASVTAGAPQPPAGHRPLRPRPHTPSRLQSGGAGQGARRAAHGQPDDRGASRRQGRRLRPPWPSGLGHRPPAQDPPGGGRRLRPRGAGERRAGGRSAHLLVQLPGRPVADRSPPGGPRRLRRAVGESPQLVEPSARPLVRTTHRDSDRGGGREAHRRLEGAFCHGPGKLDRGSYLPLLRACGGPVAVNPDRRLREAAASAGWPVLRLR